MSAKGAFKGEGASVVRFARLLFAALLALACSPSSPSGAGVSPLTCAPGQQMACACGAVAGVATCMPTGTMGACSCGVGGAPVTTPPVGGAVGAGGSSGTTPPASGQLPCDVASIISTHCLLCHTNPPQYTAPMPLLTWADFHTMGVRTQDQQVYQLVGTRISSTQAPMPPAPNAPLSDTEKATVMNWINAGALPATGQGCDLTPPSDPNGTGGTSGGGGSAIGGTSNIGGMSTSGGGTAGAAGGGSYVDATGGPADCTDYYQFTAHDGQTPDDTDPYPVPSNTANDGNQYTCFYFDPPYKPDSEGLWFYPIIKNTAVLHHWLLYATDAKTHANGTTAPCQAVEPGAYLIAGWAPGASPTQLPADVGLALPTGPNAGFILEVHHFNPNPSVPQTDASGVKFCTAPANTRPHTAGVHFTGSEGICLNPNAQTEVSGVCNPIQTQGDIHIVNVWPHMHKLGTRMSVTITRADGTMETVHDQPFDFNAQISYPKDVVIHPGDSMQTNCYYDNTTAAKVPFGENTQDEMCYGFITAWPIGALAVDPTKIDVVQLIGAGIQQKNRCMNLVSILQSCNGLADYPTVK
ncbi:MAG TPA: hypothetical protein VH062_07040 [Polyangiaceae bacterium]|jgi:hypothetical protein|nr:hypothetical protein [Polyangiaceae bacterium]